jgi:dipeptidyl aminopeptidase/acylaminoacyl peptidase
MYRVDESGQPQPLGSVLAEPGIGHGDLVEYGGEVLCVQETTEASGAGDALIAIPTVGPGKPRVLARTDGFFAAPRPAGRRLAWLRWGTDQMPWDGAELWVGRYRPGAHLTDAIIVAGGRDESVLEPRWGPDGDLYFVSDRSGWWNLYRWDGSRTRPVAPMDAECAPAPWELGYSSYAFLGNGGIVVTVQEGPCHALALIAGDGDGYQRIDVPYTSFKPYLAAHRRAVGVIASSASAAPQVVQLQLGEEPPRVEVLARAESAELDGLAISTPQQLSVTTSGDRHIAALLYPPTGAEPGWRAPLIVRAHPGPTASSALRLDWQVQFFTSRGLAVVDVDYVGSTGYGRRFRESLYGRWGIDDVADCRAVAEYLVDAGRAIAGQIFVHGASAGGYTALQAVSVEGPFAAATAISAIVDPDRWVRNAPRFQRAHATQLQSGAGRVRAEAIRTPVLLVHGFDDQVAPPAEVIALDSGLRTRRVPHRLLMLGDVGHEVAVSADAQTALQAEFQLYRTIVEGREVPPGIW